MGRLYDYTLQWADGRLCPVPHGRVFQIGRSRGQAQLKNDPLISGIHCTLFWDGDQLLLRDENSTNGTFHNQKRVGAYEDRVLRNGDMIYVGQTYFRIGSEISVPKRAPSYPTDTALPMNRLAIPKTIVQARPVLSASSFLSSKNPVLGVVLILCAVFLGSRFAHAYVAFKAYAQRQAQHSGVVSAENVSIPKSINNSSERIRQGLERHKWYRELPDGRKDEAQTCGIKGMKSLYPSEESFSGAWNDMQQHPALIRQLIAVSYTCRSQMKGEPKLDPSLLLSWTSLVGEAYAAKITGDIEPTLLRHNDETAAKLISRCTVGELKGRFPSPADLEFSTEDPKAFGNVYGEILARCTEKGREIASAEAPSSSD